MTRGDQERASPVSRQLAGPGSTKTRSASAFAGEGRASPSLLNTYEQTAMAGCQPGLRDRSLRGLTEPVAASPKVFINQ
jgi:hypothetical protein